jgi:hypothetical protein
VRTAYPDETQDFRPATTMTQPAIPLLHGGIWWTSDTVKRLRPVCPRPTEAGAQTEGYGLAAEKGSRLRSSQ